MLDSLEKLRQLIPEAPAQWPQQDPVWLDMHNGGEFNPRRYMSEALLYLHPGEVNTLVVLCRPAKEDTKLPDKFWSTLLQQGVHVLMLEDRRKLHFTAGLRPLGSSLATSIDTIKRLIDALGVETVLTAGSSAAGPGALALTAALSAKRSLLFSPVTTTLTDFYAERTSPTSSDSVVARRWQRLQSHIPPQNQFCGGALLRGMNPPPQLRVHYPSRFFWDREWVSVLQGITGVTLVAHEQAEKHGLLADEVANSPLAQQEVIGFLLNGIVPTNP